MIFGKRIEQAREFRGMTQSELAAMVGIRQPTIAQIETGLHQPAEGTVQALAQVLQFPTAFFAREPSQFYSTGTLQFRARESLTAKQRRRSVQYAQLVFEAAFRLASRLKVPVLRIPRVNGDPETAASIVRAELGLSPDSPIKNLLNVVERAGAFVFALPDLIDACDGFSAWGGEHATRPGIFLNSMMPPDRQRLTVAHEVGELALLDLPDSRDREALANRFAGAFLVPADALVRALVPPVTLSDLLPLKQIWGVSVAALIVRAHHLELIDSKRYRSLFVQLSARGWRHNEPGSNILVQEKPRAFRKMVELLYGAQPDYKALCADLALDPMLVRRLINSQAAGSEYAPPTLNKSDGARRAAASTSTSVLPFRKRDD